MLAPLTIPAQRVRGGPSRRWTPVPTADLPSALLTLQALAQRQERLDLAVAAAVAAGRCAGGTWRALGDALGVDGKTLWRRYDALVVDGA